MRDPATLGSWCSALAAFTFAAIWVLGLRARRGADAGWRASLGVALLVSALAPALGALARSVPAAVPLARATALLEPVAWTVVLAGRIGRPGEAWRGLGPVARRTLVLVGLVVLVAAALEPPTGRLGAALEGGSALLGLGVLGFLLRSLDEERFWQLKYLLAAVAAILAVHLLTAGWVLREPGVTRDPLDLGHAVIALLAAPLVQVSLRRLDEQAVGRARDRPALGGLLAGLVTVYAAAVGWLSFAIRDQLGALGPPLAPAAGIALVLLLALAVASGSLQALGRRLLGRVLGARFDYEQEWLRFIETVAGGAAESDEDLPTRVICAVGEAVDATGGAVWLRGPGDRYELAAIRNLPRPPVPLVEAPGLGELLGELDGPLELDRLASIVGAPPWPAWLPPPPRGWLILPLVHRGTLTGLMVLAEPRAGRTLSAEERRLLRILGREAASYLAEDRATRALAESRQLTAFSRRFAHLVHDLKNIAAELTLAAGNARRHLDDPRFRVDLQRSLDELASRLRGLLDRLREDAGRRSEVVDLARLLATARGSRPGRRPRLLPGPERLPARVDGASLLAALRHLVDNAFEATGERGPVELGLRSERDMAVIEVRDGGPGLPGAGDGELLVRPFVTSKPDGLGLGLVAARDLVQSLGGRLEVESRPGRGTVARIFLPRLEAGG